MESKDFDGHFDGVLGCAFSFVDVSASSSSDAVLFVDVEDKLSDGVLSFFEGLPGRHGFHLFAVEEHGFEVVLFHPCKISKI